MKYKTTTIKFTSNPNWYKQGFPSNEECIRLFEDENKTDKE